jgi:hypothetical protein
VVAAHGERVEAKSNRVEPGRKNLSSRDGSGRRSTETPKPERSNSPLALGRPVSLSPSFFSQTRFTMQPVLVKRQDDGEDFNIISMCDGIGLDSGVITPHKPDEGLGKGGRVLAGQRLCDARLYKKNPRGG